MEVTDLESPHNEGKIKHTTIQIYCYPCKPYTFSSRCGGNISTRHLYVVNCTKVDVTGVCNFLAQPFPSLLTRTRYPEIATELALFLRNDRYQHLTLIFEKDV